MHICSSGCDRELDLPKDLLLKGGGVARRGAVFGLVFELSEVKNVTRWCFAADNVLVTRQPSTRDRHTLRLGWGYASICKLDQSEGVDGEV